MVSLGELDSSQLDQQDLIPGILTFFAGKHPFLLGSFDDIYSLVSSGSLA